ncbi:MAG: ribosome maturation factor, partial [Ignavibacteriae bacterium HGW-Ignavibacteriae-3]
MEKLQINSRIEEIVKAHGFILVDLATRGDNHLRIIEVFIDGEKGVTALDCANVSRDIDQAIESEKLVDKNYRLDVSSPGVERPLKFLVQYVKHINRKFELEYNDGGE